MGTQVQQKFQEYRDFYFEEFQRKEATLSYAFWVSPSLICLLLQLFCFAECLVACDHAQPVTQNVFYCIAIL